MQKLILIGCLLLTLIIAPVDAQNDTYRLRQPSATEYFQAIGDHLAENQAMTVEGDIRNETISAVSISILRLISTDNTATFERLYEVYQRLNIGYLDGVYRGEWNMVLVRQWLDENQPDLSALDELELAPEFVVNVTPHDFNADGRDEYVLDVYNVDTVHMYLVAVPESTGYSIIDPGLPWTGYTPWGRYSEGEGQITEYDFRDINADGLPEWLVLLYDVTAGGPGMGYSDSGELYILGWRNNTLGYLAYTRLDAPEGVAWGHLLTFADAETIGDTLPATVRFDFRNIDDDPALEILQSKPTTNNWGCRRVETKRFNWDADADLYLYHDTEVVYDSDTQNCLQQSAEEAMWDGDYAAATDQFERALSHPTILAEEDWIRELEQSQNQYLRARLAMAYLFTSQPESAATLLTELAEETINDAAVAAYVEVLHDHQNADPIVLCSAAFNVFTQLFPAIVIGGTSDRPYYDGPAYIPAQIGCDAPTLIRERLDTAQIPVSMSPIDWLQNNGVGIAKTFAADLNRDGTDEVLVWTDVPGVQVLFVPDSDNYAISLPAVDPYHYADELDTWLMPGDAGLGLATLDIEFIGAYTQQPPWPTIYTGSGGMGGGPVPQCPSADTTSSTKVVRVWRLEGTMLTGVLGLSTCADTIAAALGAGGERSITTTYQDYRYIPDEGDVLEQYTYTFVWDDTEQRYVWQHPATPTPQVTVVPTPTLTPEATLQRTYYSAPHAFADEAYTAVLDMTPTTLDLAAAEDRNTMLAEMYLRALSLEALGQDESALTVFISLHEAAPDNIVGKLAALHFEVMSSE